KQKSLPIASARVHRQNQLQRLRDQPVLNEQSSRRRSRKATDDRSISAVDFSGLVFFCRMDRTAHQGRHQLGNCIDTSSKRESAVATQHNRRDPHKLFSSRPSSAGMSSSPVSGESFSQISQHVRSPSGPVGSAYQRSPFKTGTQSERMACFAVVEQVRRISELNRLGDVSPQSLISLADLVLGDRVPSTKHTFTHSLHRESDGNHDDMEYDQEISVDSVSDQLNLAVVREHGLGDE